MIPNPWILITNISLSRFHVNLQLLSIRKKFLFFYRSHIKQLESNNSLRFPFFFLDAPVKNVNHLLVQVSTEPSVFYHISKSRAYWGYCKLIAGHSGEHFYCSCISSTGLHIPEGHRWRCFYKVQEGMGSGTQFTTKTLSGSKSNKPW